MWKNHRLVLLSWMAHMSKAKHTPIPLTVGFRGGASSSPYELNPNYEDVNSPARPVTLGDLERRRVLNGPPPNTHDMWVEPGPSHVNRRGMVGGTRGSSSESIGRQIQTYFARLHQMSPTLSIGTLSCVVVFCLWHIPSFQSTLQKYFVCSRSNVLQRKRYPALLLSAISHASLTHLLVNLFAFVTFGPSVRQILMSSSALSTAKSGGSLWPLAVGAAMAGSISYLLLGGRGGAGCMGLSGVTLSLLAMHAQAYPKRELGFVIGVFPIRLPAQQALACLLLWSFLGSITGQKGRVAHAAHLGGIIFGMAYYELWLRRQAISNTLRKAHRILLSKGR